MSTVGAVVLAAALLLLAAGASKIVSPAATSRMLAELFPRLSLASRGPWLARMLGAVELGVAAYVIVAGSRTAYALFAAAYLVATVVAVRLWKAGTAECGCFGTPASGRSAPMTRGHVVVDALACILAAVASIAPSGPTAGASHPDLATALGLCLAALLAWLAYLAMTSLPALLSARSPEV